MAMARSPSPGGDSGLGRALLLGGARSNGDRMPGRTPSLRGAARFLRRASSRRMREQSIMVRETAAEHLEGQQSDWAYSKPVVFLDVLWNVVFVCVAVVVLALSRHETPSMPLRLWVMGYAFQCVIHMICVCVEYHRRHNHVVAILAQEEAGSGRRSGLNSPTEVGESAETEQGQEEHRISCVKHLESANTMFSFVWWIIGFYWISAGGQVLNRDAPQLYWLCIVFLAFDVLFVVFCVALACVIGIAVCCCLPCIIAILYAVSDQYSPFWFGACMHLKNNGEYLSSRVMTINGKYMTHSFHFKNRKEQLKKIYANFQSTSSIKFVKNRVRDPGTSGGIMTECSSDPPLEHALSAEDAECCICLSHYEDGVELRELPCGHHFHCGCVDKWLHINATCPLCKFNILKNNHQRGAEV